MAKIVPVGCVKRLAGTGILAAIINPIPEHRLKDVCGVILADLYTTEQVRQMLAL